MGRPFRDHRHVIEGRGARVSDRVRVARVQWFLACLLVLGTAVLLGFPAYAVYRLYPDLR